MTQPPIVRVARREGFNAAHQLCNPALSPEESPRALARRFITRSFRWESTTESSPGNHEKTQRQFELLMHRQRLSRQRVLVRC